MKEIQWPRIDSEHLTVYSKQMLDLENEILSKGMPVESLMEKVGLRISDWLLNRRDLLKNGVIVVIGPGHNGGDGAVVARELFLKGILTKVWCPLPIKKTLTAKQLDYITSIGVEKLTKKPDPLENDLWIDAILGNNQSRCIDEEIVKMFNKKSEQNCGNTISIDIPTGICPDSGKPFSIDAIRSKITLSIGIKKIGILQDAAIPFVGKIYNIDIGLSSKHLSLIETRNLSISCNDIQHLKLSLPPINHHKYSRGRTLLIVGSSKFPGAAMLAIKGALASGVGSTKVILPEAIAKSVWELAPEIVSAGYLDISTEGNSLMYEALSVLDLEEFDTIMIGPGIGIDSEDWEKSREKLKTYKGLLILDADALNRIARSISGSKFFLERTAKTWITPHSGEFQRLFPELVVNNSVEAALSIAREFNIGILLKGANSVIADPRNNAWQIYDNNCIPARAGFGDLLSGFVAGLSALELASREELKTESLAKYALIHSYAGAKSKKGSTASIIGKKLAEIMKDIKTRQML